MRTAEINMKSGSSNSLPSKYANAVAVIEDIDITKHTRVNILAIVAWDVILPPPRV